MNKEEYAEKKLKVDSDTVDGVDYEREVLETSYEDGQRTSWQNLQILLGQLTKLPTCQTRTFLQALCTIYRQRLQI